MKPGDIDYVVAEANPGEWQATGVLNFLNSEEFIGESCSCPSEAVQSASKVAVLAVSGDIIALNESMEIGCVESFSV